MLFLSALSLASVALASPIGLGSSLFTRQTQCASAAPSCPSDPKYIFFFLDRSIAHGLRR